MYQLEKVIKNENAPALAKARARLAIASSRLAASPETSFGDAKDVEAMVRPAIPDLVNKEGGKVFF